MKRSLTSLVAGLALVMGLGTSALAEDTFSLLKGIQAEAMTPSEMDEVQGKGCILASSLGGCSGAFSGLLTNLRNSSPGSYIGVNTVPIPGFGIQEQINLRNFFVIQVLNAAANGSTSYDVLNAIGAQMNALGIPFGPIQSPFPSNYPAAASGNLNSLLGMTGQPGLPFANPNQGIGLPVSPSVLGPYANFGRFW